MNSNSMDAQDNGGSTGSQEGQLDAAAAAGPMHWSDDDAADVSGAQDGSLTEPDEQDGDNLGLLDMSTDEGVSPLTTGPIVGRPGTQ